MIREGTFELQRRSGSKSNGKYNNIRVSRTEDEKPCVEPTYECSIVRSVSIGGIQSVCGKKTLR
jgi:hypothetical protein